MRRGLWIAIILLVLMIGIWYFMKDRPVSGFTISNEYSGIKLLGNFEDIAKGDYFISDYDIFWNGKSMGHFSSALEVCRTLWPKTKNVAETAIVGDEHEFTSKSGSKRIDYGYVNYCYG